MAVSPKTLIPLILALALLALFPLGMPRFYTYILALIITTGLLSTSMNLVLGHGGIYQFNHAVFYGIGAYGAAVLISKFHYSPWISFIIGPLMAAVASLIMGIICVRLSKLYFGMLQVSLGSLVWAITDRWYSVTGGDDGIHGITMPDIISTSLGSYYFVLIVGACAFLLMYLILKSPFGSTLQGIRDNVVRSQAIGVNVRVHQLTGLVLAGFFGGIAGVLFVVVDTSVFPDDVLDPLHGDHGHGPPRWMAHLLRAPLGCLHHHPPSDLRQCLHRILDPHPRDHPHARHHLLAPGGARLCARAVQER